MDEILTVGTLDALHFEPVVDETGTMLFLRMSVQGLPGLNVILQGVAARELRDALSIVLERFKVVA